MIRKVEKYSLKFGVDLHELLNLWLDRLVDGGEAWLVVHQHLGAGSLAGWLGEQGWAVEKVKSKKGYRILRVRQT